MADNLGLVIQVNYTASQHNIDEAIKKLQEHVNTKKLHIAFDTESIKGLDQISKAIAPAISQTNNLNTSMHNLGNSVNKLNKESKIDFFSGGKLTQTKEIKEMEDALGKLHKVTKTFSEGNETHRIVEDTTNYKKQREEVDKLTNSMANLREKSEARIKTDANKSDLAQTSAINKTIEKENLDRIKAQQNASDMARRLIVEEENRRIATTTEAQSRIERTILGSNETISQQQIRMNSVNGQNYEQVWHRAIESRRIEEERLAQRQIENAERTTQRQQQLYAGLFNQTERSIQQQARLLNTRMQSALGLGNNISNNLTPESSRVLEHQLERYRNIIRQFQANNEIGITIRPEQLTQLQNLENRIRRFYETVRQGQNDSHGFNFTQYEQFTRLNPAITNATHAQQYYNTSLLEGHRLIASNIQQTEQYIRVTQQLRNGSQHLNLGVYIDRATGQMYQFNEALRDGMTRSWGLGEAMSTAATKAMVWSVVMGTMYSFLNILQQIPSAIIEIDTRLVEMSKVMSSDTDFGALMDSLSKSASDYGRTITETQDAVVEFGKQGFEAAQAIEMANTALLGANVTGLKTNQMAGYLTATMAQFNIVAEDSVSIVNKINEVDNNFAVTSQGLAQSLAKAGESAQLYGASLDNVIGYTTAIQTATKESGNVIGNSLKSTISRTFSDDSEKILNSVGIAIRDISGEVRTVDQIWGDLAVKFKTLSNEQRQQIGLTIGSRYHLTRFLALMDNWDIVTKATTTSQQSLFSALEENRKHLASLESQINKVKSAGQILAYTLGENGLGAAMSGVLGATTTFIKGLNELANLSTTAKIAITALSLTAIGLTLQITNVIGAIVKLGIAMKTMAIANPWLAVIVGLATVTVGVAGYLGKQKQLKEEQDKITETVEKSTKAFNDLNEVMDKIGSPSLQNVNDAEAEIKKFDLLISKIKEASEEKDKFYTHDEELGLIQANVSYDPTKLSDEMKDLATNLGINILQIKDWAEFIAIAKLRQDELSGSLVTGKKNSTEYQAEQIKSSQTQLDMANNTRDLVNEYKELSTITEKNEQQTKRFAEVKNMLLAMFPEESANGKIIIEALEREANKRVELAEAASKGSKEQLEANRKTTQSAYETAIKNMALYQGEIDRLKELWDARTNNARIPDSGSIGGLDILETSRIGGKIKAYESAKSSVDSLAKSISEMDDILNWKPASVSGTGDDKKDSSASKSSSSPKPQDPSYTSPIDSLIQEANALSNLTAERNKSLQTEISQAKSNKDYQLALEKTNSLLQSQQTQLQQLSTARDKINALKDSAISASSPQFGDTSRWFNDSNEQSSTYVSELNSQTAETQETMESTFTTMQKLRKTWVENKYAVSTLTAEMTELQSTILDINYDIVKSDLESHSKQIDSISDSLSLLKTEQSQYDQQSIQYSDNQKQQIELLKQKSEAIQSEIDHLQILIATTNLTASAQEELQSTLTSLYSSLSSTKSETLSIYNSIADSIISTMKKAYEKQKDIAISKIEKEMDYEDKRHEKKLENLDKEMQRYQDAYDEKMKLINDEASAEDYNLNLTNAQKEAQKIQNDINILSLDDSIEAKFKREELETQLADKITEIEKMQKDHSRDLRKDALSEQLDAYKTDIDAKKDAEDEKYDSIKDSLDKQKTDTEYMYNELINDERNYAKIRLQIINGNVAGIQNTMSNFLDSFGDMNKSTASDIGESWQDILSLIEEVKSASEEVDDLKSSKSSSSSSNSSNNPTTQTSKITVYGTETDVRNAKTVGSTSKFNYVIVPVGSNLDGEAKSEDLVLGGSAVIKGVGSGSRIWGETAEDTLAAFKKKIAGYKTGGVNDIPGLTMLHGTNSSVETIFNATDGKKLWDLVHNLPNLSANMLNNSIKLPDFSKLSLASKNSEIKMENSITFNIDGGKGLSKNDLTKASDFIFSQIRNGMKVNFGV